MANPAASPPANIDFTCTNMEEIFNLSDKLASGSPLPSNVIDNVNPYIYEPQNLPGGVWILINSEESINVGHGFWKTKEEACEVFSNTDIIGWRTTLEYYKHQFHKTDYVMQVFSTTQKRIYDYNEKKETSSLCRVFPVPSQEMHHNVSRAGVDSETRNNIIQPPFLDASSSIGSSNNPEVNKHDETEVSVVAERIIPAPEHHEQNLVRMDYLSREQIVSHYSRGDFLELDDLDNPASPSSSSENSSALSISSDEDFDAMVLEDLDEHFDLVVEQNDASRRLNVSASKRSDEVVIVPATLESLVSVEGSNSNSDGDEFFKTAGSVPVSASGSKDLKNNVKDNAGGDQKDEGPSSSREPSASASGRKRAGFGGIRNLRKKYLLCFMPF